MHYTTLLAPAIGNIAPWLAHPPWEDAFIRKPWFFVADGYVAVSLFFLISGMVLTSTFASGSAGMHVLRRLIRLGLPMGGAVLLAAFWFLVFPRAHVLAAQDFGPNPWLAALGPPRVTVGNTLNELFAGGMLLGQQGETLLPGPVGKWLGLAPAAASFNAPLWTLHLEFYGSLLVLLMARLQARMPPKAFRRVYYALLFILVMHPLDLFLLGFGAARLVRRPGWQVFAASARGRGLAVIALVLGICASSHGFPKTWGREFERICNIIRLPMRLDAFHAYGQYGAILIFFAVLALPALQRGLGARLGRGLGRYSFSLYLVHFPILFTLTSALMVALRPFADGWVAAVTGGLLVTGLVTVLFERFVDAPATRLSRRLGGASIG